MWRFRRRVRIAPGIYLNFSTKGVSTTVGIPGFSVNVGPKGVYLNRGIPGTGIYSRVRIDGKKEKSKETKEKSKEEIQERETLPKKNLPPLKSALTKNLSSENFYKLRDAFYGGLREKYNLKLKTKSKRRKYLFAKTVVLFLHIILIGFFMPFLKKWLWKKYFSYHKTRLKSQNYRLKFQVKLEKSYSEEFAKVKEYFQELTEKSTIWDIIARELVVPNINFDYSFMDCERVKVSFSFRNAELASLSGEKPLNWENANGGNLYIYPFFILVEDLKNIDFAVIDFRTLSLSHKKVRFLEDNLPPNSKSLGVSYLYVRQDGQKDLRFRINPMYSVLEYYELELKTAEGLNEIYLFSNADLASQFCHALEKYIRHVGQVDVIMD